jgi:hypothetical protein
MGTYGRNFDFRIVPTEEQRHGRYILSGTTDVPIGAPLKVAAAASPDTAFSGALPALLATGAQAPKRGMAGIGVYEHIEYRGVDPLLTTFSDLDMIPHGRMFQLVSGAGIKVVFHNTLDRSYLGLRDYQGRIIVAGMGATPTVTVGDYLTPGTGDDDNGYWAETGTAANGWLVVTLVDSVKGEVEAELTF